MIALVVASTRLCASASWGQWVAWLLVASFAAPFAAYAVRARKQDIRVAATLGLTILLVVGVLIGTAHAGPPMRDQCEVCLEAGMGWICYLMGCW